MKIGLVVKPIPEFRHKLCEVLVWLHARNCLVVLEQETAELFELNEHETSSREKLPAEVDLLLVFGGDGTLLSVARAIRDRRTPVLGINLGSLGFLTEVTLSELYPTLESVLKGRCEIELRRLAQADVRRNGQEPQSYHALNDIVINRGALARMITLETYVEGGLIARFLADGLIVSTPTGSTAYSMSAGGPILFPTLDAVLITPICPHTLTNRPVVVPGDSAIRVVLRSGDEATLAMDGQVGVPLTEGDQVDITRSPFAVQLVKPVGKSFFDVLREKLKWGER